MKVVLVAAAALIRDNSVLLAQRPAGKAMAGLWEFPGGKVEAAEVPEAALIRELDEELGIRVRREDLSELAFASHTYDKFHLLMPVWSISTWDGEPTGAEGQVLRWVGAGDLDDFEMPAADYPLLPAVRRALAG